MSRLASVVIPEASALRRDLPAVVRDWREEFEPLYDRRTLAYDVFYVPARRAFCMMCPPLFNLEAPLRAAEILADGRPVSIRRIVRYKRYCEVWLGAAGPAEELRFRFGDFEAIARPAVQDLERFAGLNAIYTRSKNNRIDWIVDWARYHVRLHNAQALVFVDNGSTAYDSDEIRAGLETVEGLRSLVIDAPFPYGVAKLHETKFFQVAIMNMVRRRFLTRARAVLCTDVDELIAPIEGADVFERTARSMLGYQLFRGQWLERDPAYLDQTPRHAQHLRRLASGGAMRATKYCIAPQGLLRGTPWDIHGAVRGFLKDRLVTDRVTYWHCRNISTDWAPYRKRAEARTEGLEPDAAAERAFAEAFD